MLATLITLVHSPACHFCENAEVALAELSVDYPIEVELVDVQEPRGQALVAAQRAGMFPLVLVDGEYFSVGRLPRKKLRKLLDSRPVVA